MMSYGAKPSDLQQGNRTVSKSPGGSGAPRLPEVTSRSSGRLKKILGYGMICSLLSLLSVLAFLTVRTEVNRYADMAEHSAVSLVNGHLSLADALYEKLTTASIQVLKSTISPLGPVQIKGTANIGGKAVPGLSFGETSMVNNFEWVDKVARLMGGTATLFVRDGNDFVRVTTNVKKSDGTRAIGTLLDPSGPAIAAVRQGKTFKGVVEILQKPYWTIYEPLTNAGGEVLGIWYAGYPIDSLDALRAELKHVQILEHGFTAVLDASGRVMFQSEEMAAAQNARLIADAVASAEPEAEIGGYRVHRQFFPAWKFVLVSAIYLPDLNVETLQLIWKFLGLMVVISVLTLYVFHRFYDTRQAITDVMGDLVRTGQRLGVTSSQLARSSQTLSAGASEQSDSVERTSASLEEISTMIRLTADNAQKAKVLAGETRLVVESGSQAMAEMTAAIDQIENASGMVAKIAKTIDEIAFQTNILALNAAVEAARAGDIGAGFGVVASEVRSLAQRSASAARETAEKIEAAIASSRLGAQATANMQASLLLITTKAVATDTLIGDIAVAAREQSLGVEQSHVALRQMDRVSQDNATNAELGASAAGEIDTHAELLNALVDKLQRLVASDQAKRPLSSGA